MDPSIILIIIIAVFYPLYIILSHKRIKEKIVQNPVFRKVDYKQTILIFWFLTLLILANNAFFQSNISLGLSFHLNVLSVLISVLIAGIIIFLFTQLKIDQEGAGLVKEKMKDIYHYLPKNKHELKWFICLSVSAGICEEIIFRGFLSGALNQFVNIWVAVGIANLVFALTHIGSGNQNLISSFALGLLFSGICYLTDSLWPAIFLHSAIDIYSGMLGYKSNKLQQEKEVATTI